MSKSNEATDKSFGLFFGVVFAILFAYVAISGNNTKLLVIFGSLSVIFPGIGLYKPHVLSPLKQCWLIFGRFLHRIISPIIIFLIFIILIAPIGVFFRVCKRDLLRLRAENQRQTWNEVEPKNYDVFFDNQY